MTIKQLGGIFGRNPTFEDVEVDNNLVVDNNLIVNNRIGVETNSPDESVHLYEPSGGDLALKIQSNPSFAYSSTRIKMKAGNLGVNEIYFGDASSDDIAKIRYEHSTNAMAFKVNNQEALRINSSGNLVVLSGQGIDFSATSGTGTSELFDDYEEGTWTPAYTPTTGSFTTITTVSTGRYTKVGRLVTIFGSMRTSGTLDTTGASGNLKITGLPFACNSTIPGGGSDINHQAWSLGTDILQSSPYVFAGTSEILLYKNTMNGSSFPNGPIFVSEMNTSGGSFNNLLAFVAQYEV